MPYIIGALSLAILAGLLAALLWQTGRRRLAEAALRASQERFRVVADTAPVMIWESGIDKRCVFFNRPWLEFTGRSMDEEAGDGWATGVHPDDLAQCLKEYGDAFDRREPFRLEYRLRRADGEYRWLLDSGVCQYGSEGAFTGYIGSCVDVTDLKHTAQALDENASALRSSHARVQDLAGRLITAQEVERARIARDLHDHVCQDIAGVAVLLTNLKRQGGQVQDPQIQQALAVLRERAVSVAEDLRHLSHDLHPSVLEHIGLVAALEAHCIEVERQHDLQVSFSSAPDLGAIESETALCLYRIAQEALRNTWRHADARRASVSVTRSAGHFDLAIVDDGQGFDLDRVRQNGGGLGLLSIEERTLFARGTVKIHARPGHGTELYVRIPVETQVALPVDRRRTSLASTRSRP